MMQDGVNITPKLAQANFLKLRDEIIIDINDQIFLSHRLSVDCLRLQFLNLASSNVKTLSIYNGIISDIKLRKELEVV